MPTIWAGPGRGGQPGLGSWAQLGRLALPAGPKSPSSFSSSARWCACSLAQSLQPNLFTSYMSRSLGTLGGAPQSTWARLPNLNLQVIGALRLSGFLFIKLWLSLTLQTAHKHQGHFLMDTKKILHTISLELSQKAEKRFCAQIQSFHRLLLLNL